MKPLIAPSILSANFARLGEDVRAVLDAGAEIVHFDVMDNHFVPNLTIGPLICEALRNDGIEAPIDVHLMVEDPDAFLEPFAQAGADALGVHVEACAHLHRTLQAIRDLGKRPCVVINPATPAEPVREVLHMVDQVLVMTVNPGFGGQKFIRETLPKIETIRGWIDASGRDVDLVVDGGVGLDTVADVASAGANVFVMGSAFYGSRDRKVFVEEVRGKLTAL